MRLAAAKTDIGSFQRRSERHPLPIYSLRDFDYIGGVSPSLPKFTRGALQRNKVILRLTDRGAAEAAHTCHTGLTRVLMRQGLGASLRCEMQRVPEILQFPVIVERRRSPALEPQPF